MAGTDDSMAKICSMCGTDCTNKPRVKDAKGNYYCKVCAEKVGGKKSAESPPAAAPRAPKAAPKAPSVPAGPSEQNIMAKLVDESLSQAAGACPACRKKLKPGAVICTNCGFSTVSGQIVQTAIQKPELIVDKSVKKTRRKLRLDPSIAILIALVVFGGLLGLSFVSPVFVGITMLIVVLYQLGLMLMVTISAFQDGEAGWGITGVLSFFFGCAWLAMIYYIWFVTDREHLKSLWLIGFVSYVVTIVMYVLNQEEVLNAMQEAGVNAR